MSLKRLEWVAEAEADESVEGLPEREVGQEYRDVQGRLWRKVRIAHGLHGAQWAYWVKGKEGEDVIADGIFNECALHFAGMLRIKYSGEAGKEEWILTGKGFHDQR